jgi:hypothetical protein
MSGFNIFIATAIYISVLMINGDNSQWMGNLVSIGAFLLTLVLIRNYQARK